MRLAAPVLGLVTALLAGLSGCAAPERRAFTPAELLAEETHRASTLPAAERIVPFEISPADGDKARALVRGVKSDDERMHILAEALFDPRQFGLKYAPGETVSGEEALRSREGDCFALASAFIGIARATGLRAYYVDASARVHETKQGQAGIIVNVGHVTAVVDLGKDKVALDVERLGPFRWYRILSDVEAVAHYYNNQGYEVSSADWARAAHDFRIAVELFPGLSLAWNNLGIANARLGHLNEARDDYLEAIRCDATFAAPHNNLGALLMEEGKTDLALPHLEAAARLEPGGSHIQYNLALALLEQGNRAGAIQALHRALDLREDYPEAHALLDQIDGRRATP